MAVSPTFAKTYGPWAVVTGASSGIGAEFATQLASNGLSIVLVARRADRLETLSKSLREAYSIDTLVITADLSTPSGVTSVLEQTTHLDIGLLINNAGVEYFGAFLRADEDAVQRMIHLNISAVSALAHGFGKRFILRTRRDDSVRAGVLFLSSMANMATPYMATYTATKAFVSAFAMALRTEWQDDHVDCLSLEPGLVSTEMKGRVTQDFDAEKAGMTAIPAEQCVVEALGALERFETKWTPGRSNRVMKFFMGLLPETTRIAIMKSTTLKLTADSKLLRNA